MQNRFQHRCSSTLHLHLSTGTRLPTYITEFMHVWQCDHASVWSAARHGKHDGEFPQLLPPNVIARKLDKTDVGVIHSNGVRNWTEKVSMCRSSSPFPQSRSHIGRERRMSTLVQECIVRARAWLHNVWARTCRCRGHPRRPGGVPPVRHCSRPGGAGAGDLLPGACRRGRRISHRCVHGQPAVREAIGRNRNAGSAPVAFATGGRKPRPPIFSNLPTHAGMYPPPSRNHQA